MKRFHTSIAVTDLDKSVAFYTALFAAEPTVLHADYAKWMLDDPRINFSLTTHGARPGIDHIGVEVDDDAELAEIRHRVAAAQGPIFEQPDVGCCYAQSSKAWTRDPDGVAWEAFLSRGPISDYSDGSETSAVRGVAGRCCTGQ